MNDEKDSRPRLKAKRLFPYLIALVLLAWILGSLARSGTGGGSLLSNSIWLVYAIELSPLIALGLMIVLIGYIALNWRLLSDALGFGMSHRRRLGKKKSWRGRAIIWMATWGIAGMLLLTRCGGLICKSTTPEGILAPVKQLVVGSGPLPQIPLLGPLVTLSSLVDTNLFIYAFLGIALLGSIIIVRAVKVHLEETRREGLGLVEVAQEQGRIAAQDAIRLLDVSEGEDPRLRIMACYQRMVKAAAGLGAPVGPDKTARELERGIRGMFLLNGSGISRLTNLFEVARYSLHPVTEEDSRIARECLVEISRELDRAVLVEA